MNYMSFSNIGFPFLFTNGYVGFPNSNTIDFGFNITFPEWERAFYLMFVANIRFCTQLQTAFVPLMTGLTKNNRDHLKLIYVDGQYVG